MTDSGVGPNVPRKAGISYLRVPAQDPPRTAAFYGAVFGWKVDLNRPDPSFEDGTGHVIEHFISSSRVSGEAGIRPYIYVAQVDNALASVAAHGGAVVEAPYPEGDLWVATFRDPSGRRGGGKTGDRWRELCVTSPYGSAVRPG